MDNKHCLQTNDETSIKIKDELLFNSDNDPDYSSLTDTTIKVEPDDNYINNELGNSSLTDTTIKVEPDNFDENFVKEEFFQEELVRKFDV